MLRGSLLTYALLFLLLVSFGAPAQAADTWEPIGPFGATVMALAADPGSDGVYYAGTRADGVYLSADGGVNWTRRSFGLPEDVSTGGFLAVCGLAVDPVDGRVYAMGVSEIYASDDAGVNWTVVTRPSGAAGAFSALFFDSADDQRLVVSNRKGVYTSGDRGQTWTQPAGITQIPIWDLERSPVDAAVYFAVAGSAPELYRSGDGVGSWTAVGSLPGNKIRDLAVSATDADMLYASLDTGVFCSEDAGLTWFRMDDPADQAEIYCLYVRGDERILGVGRGGLFSNPESLLSLDKINDFYYTRGAAVAAAAGNELMVATEMGIFAGGPGVIDGTEELSLRMDGINGADVGKVAPAPGSNIIYAATGQGYDAGIFRSDDAGETWELRSRGIKNPDIRSIAVFPGNPDIVYIGTADAIDDIGENGMVYKTTDGGLTWTDLSAGLFHNDPHIIISMLVHPTNADIVFVSVQGRFGGIYKSTDGGATWTRHATGLESMPDMDPQGENPFKNYFSMLSLAMSPVDYETLFIGAGGCWGGTYKTVNGGEEWLRRSSGYMEVDSEVPEPPMFPVHLTLYDIDVDPRNPMHLVSSGGRGAFVGAGQFGIVFESTDGGETWDIIREGRRSDYFSSPVTGTEFHPDKDGWLYVSSRAGVQLSEDGGQSWAWINEGLPEGVERFTRDLAVDPNNAERMYLGTAFGGVWKRESAFTPVRLEALQAAARDIGGVEVAWRVVDAVNHSGFWVDREVAGVRTRLNDTLLRGKTDYRFVDTAPQAGMENRYWVVELDRSGRETDHGPVSVQVPLPPLLGLSPAYPNPLQGSTRVLLSSRAGGAITVVVYDGQGRRVRTLVEENLRPGESREVIWDGADARGVRVGSGLYFLRAESGGNEVIRKVLLTP